MNNKSYNKILYTFVASLFIAAMDTGIVSPTRGIIAQHFGVDLPTSIWIMSIYSLGFSSSLLFMTFLAQKIGIKKVIMGAVSFFTIASLFCATAPNYIFFIAFRFIQGFFAGGIFPLATDFIGSEFPTKSKGYAMGVLGGTFALGNVMGPSIGSILLHFVGNNNWYILFWINLLFGVIALWFLKRNVYEVILNKEAKFEIFSISFASLFVLSIMLFFTFLDVNNFFKSISSWPILITVLIMITSLISTIFLSKKLNGPLLIITTLFRNQIMIKTIISALFAAFSIFGIVLYLPQISEHILNLPVGQGGYLATIVGISGTIMGPLSGKMITKYGVNKIYFVFSVLLSLSLLFMLVSLQTKNVSFFIISLILIGSSQNSVIIICSNYFIQSSFNKKLQGIAQSILILFRSNYWAIVPSVVIIILKPFTNRASLYLTKANHIMKNNKINFDICFNHVQTIKNVCKIYKHIINNSYISLVSVCLIFSLFTLLTTMWFKKVK